MWISDIIQKEPAESSTKRQKTAKPDRSGVSVVAMIQENNFGNFMQFIEGISKVAKHFQALYGVENGTKESLKATYLEALASKELTKQLYPRAKRMFELSNFRFKQQYPVLLIQWAYWVVRAIKSLQAEGDAQVWYGYLNQANGIVTNPNTRGHYKTSESNFPLQADFDSFEPEAITHNAMQSLSSRIDRLNDW